MSIESQGDLFSALSSGAFESVVGTLEADWLDFKSEPYRLDTLTGKWSLAKDVVALANERGGCLVIGYRTRRETHEIADRAVEHRPVPKSELYPDRYLKVIVDWCYPTVRNVKAHWFPLDGERAVFVLEIAPQDARGDAFPAPPCRARRPRRMPTLDDLVTRIRRHLYLPDPMPLYAVLAAVAANQLPGDPVWLLLVGPPSSGKTELLNPLDGLPGFYRPDDFTIAGLLTKGRDRALGGVLGRIARAGGVGILVVKDFSTVLAQGPTHRAGMFSMLRRLCDGEVERALGSDGGTQLHFKGKVGLLGATTDAIDQLSDEIGDLGPRMLLYRMPDIDEDAAMLAAARNTGNQTTMRADLADAVKSFLTGLDVSVWPLDPEPDVPELRALAQWAVWCRSAVLRDRWGEIEHVPRREAGMRVYANLLQLTAGAFTIGLDDITAERLVRQVALDSIPAMRRSMLDAPTPRSAPTTRTLADDTGLPTSVVRRVCKDLAALGILVRSAEAVGNEHHWSLSNSARNLIAGAGLGFVEVSP